MEVSQEQADWLQFRLGCQVVIIGLNDNALTIMPGRLPPREFMQLINDDKNGAVIKPLMNDDRKPVMLAVDWKPGAHFATITIVPAHPRADDGEEVPLETFELPFRRS